MNYFFACVKLQVKDSVISKEVKKFQSTLNNKNQEFKKIKETIEKFVDKLTSNEFDEKLRSVGS